MKSDSISSDLLSDLNNAVIDTQEVKKEPIKDFQVEKRQQPIIIDLSKPYQNWAFQGCVEHSGTRIGLNKLVVINNKDSSDRIQNIKDLYGIRINRLEERANEWQVTLNERPKEQSLETKSEQIWQEMSKKFIAFGVAKSQLIEQRLIEFKKEILALSDAHDSLYMNMYDLNKKMFSDNKPALDIRKIRAEKLKLQIENRYSEVDTQIGLTNKSGVNSHVFQLLYSNANIVALVSGWFFSVFLLLKNFAVGDTEFGSDDAWFFIIKSILNVLNSNATGLQGILEPFGKVIFIIFIIGIVSYICQWLLNRYCPIKDNVEQIEMTLTQGDIIDENTQLNSKSEQGGKKMFNLSIQADSWFALWLHIAPFLTAASIGLIILRFGVTTEDVNKLDLSLAGQFLGMTLSYGLSGLFYLVVAKNQDFPNLKRWSFVLIGLFLLMPLLFLIEFDNNTKNYGHQIISVIGFIFSAFLTSILLAYGMRYRGLLHVADEMNRLIDRLSVIISYYSAPKFVNLFSKDYPQKVQDMEKDLLTWIAGRNASIEKMQGILPESEQKKGANKGNKSLIWWNPKTWEWTNSIRMKIPKKELNTSSNEKSLNQLDNIALTEIEKLHFPQFDKEIEALRQSYILLSNNIEKQTKSSSKIGKRITKTRDDIALLYQQQNDVINQQMMQSFHQELWIREGYELGIWYLKNDLFPGFLPPKPGNFGNNRFLDHVTIYNNNNPNNDDSTPKAEIEEQDTNNEEIRQNDLEDSLKLAAKTVEIIISDKNEKDITSNE
jgi:hypothetical protein